MSFASHVSRVLIISALVGGSSVLASAHAAPATQPAPAPQAGGTTIKGQVAVSSFPTPPTQVRVTSAGMPVTDALLGADGSFTLTVPTGRDFQVQLVAGGTTYQLVFPRGTSVESSFAVQGARPAFDVGLVQYVASASATGIMVGHADPTNAKAKPACAFGKLCVDDAEAGEDVCGPITAGSPGGAAAEASPAVSGTTPSGPAAVAEHNLPAHLGCEP